MTDYHLTQQFFLHNKTKQFMKLMKVEVYQKKKKSNESRKEPKRS